MARTLPLVSANSAVGFSGSSAISLSATSTTSRRRLKAGPFWPALPPPPRTGAYPSVVRTNAAFSAANA
eukprot:4547597-Prymnesium_polylepis.2